MPVEKAPPYITPAVMDEQPLKTADQQLADDYALALVNQSFWAAEMFRTQNHDRRWNNADSLYVGYIPPRTWDGSNVARSSFTQQIIFDQVEAALPAISQNLFGIGAEWFQVQAEPGTDPHEARQIQDTLSYYLEHPKDQFGSTARAEFKLAFKNVLLYGNGGVSVEWDSELNKPVIEWVDLRDFYVDPGLSVPNIDEANYVIRRKFVSIEELIQLRKDPRMNIPSNDVLWYFAKNVPQQYAEQTKRVQEALRGVFYSPGFSDYLPLPADHKIEVLVYYSKSRIIWILNKEWVAYNGPNPYNFIPFAFAPCYIYTGRFYGQSIADVQENNQRYIEALLNAHYDEISLKLHPPRVQKRTTLLTPAQQRWRPGAVFSADNKDDVTLLQPQDATLNVFGDIEYLEGVAEKRTGINAMGLGSVPRPSNANRTLGGLQMQSAGSSVRLAEIIENIENYMLIPALYKLQRIIQFHTRPGQALPASSPQGQFYNVNASTLQKNVNFRIYAASKMITKEKLFNIVPFFAQFILQGPLVENLQKSGRTIDFDVFFEMIQDATGTSRLYQLIRPLNQQEQQALQQPPPEARAQLMAKQQEGQTRQQIMQMKVQGDLQKEMIKKQPNPYEVMFEKQKAEQEMQQKQQEMQMDMQQRQAEMRMDMLMKQIELAAKQQEHTMDLKKKQADIAVAMQASENQRQQGMMDHSMKMQQMQQMAQNEDQVAQQRQSTAEKYPLGSGAAEPKSDASTPGGSPGRPDRPKKAAEVRKKPRPPK